MHARHSAPRLRVDRLQCRIARVKSKIWYPQRTLSMVWEAGWLAWYCLGLFGGVYNEIHLGGSLHRGGSSVALAFSIFSLGIAAWNLATGIGIIRRAPFALRMVVIQLSAGGLQGLIILLAG